MELSTAIPTSITVLTVATDPSPAVTNLLTCLNVFGFTDVHVLGMGQVWTGFRMKILLYTDKLSQLQHEYSQGRLTQEPLVLMCDSADVLITQPMQNLCRAYHQHFGNRATEDESEDRYGPLVLSPSDTSRVGDLANPRINAFAQRISSMRHPIGTKHLMINSGVMMGTPRQLLRWLKPSAHCTDDQEAVTTQWLAHPHIGVIDTQSRLFATHSGNMLSQNKRWRDVQPMHPQKTLLYTPTHTTPMIHHFPCGDYKQYNLVIQFLQRAHPNEMTHLRCIPSKIFKMVTLKNHVKVCMRAYRETWMGLAVGFILGAAIMYACRKRSQ
jgi:hypothetical protein